MNIKIENLHKIGRENGIKFELLKALGW